jgi:hypothetical protein
LGQLFSFRRFEIAASQRVSPPPPDSTSTFRATTFCVTQACDPFRPGRTTLFAPVLCFGTLPPLCLAKGARSSRNRKTIMKVEQAKQIVSKAIEELSQALEKVL